MRYLYSTSLMQAFPKGSSLAIDISRATLKAIESGEGQTHCGSTGSKIQNEQLGSQPFFGLFAICGAIGLFGLLVTIVHFVKRNAQTFMNYISLLQLQRALQIMQIVEGIHPITMS